MPSNKKQVSANNNSLDIMLHDLLQKHKASLLQTCSTTTYLLQHLIILPN